MAPNKRILFFYNLGCQKHEPKTLAVLAPLTLRGNLSQVFFLTFSVTATPAAPGFVATVSNCISKWPSFYDSYTCVCVCMSGQFRVGVTGVCDHPVCELGANSSPLAEQQLFLTSKSSFQVPSLFSIIPVIYLEATVTQYYFTFIS